MTKCGIRDLPVSQSGGHLSNWKLVWVFLGVVGATLFFLSSGVGRGLWARVVIQSRGSILLQCLVLSFQGLKSASRDLKGHFCFREGHLKRGLWRVGRGQFCHKASKGASQPIRCASHGELPNVRHGSSNDGAFKYRDFRGVAARRLTVTSVKCENLANQPFIWRPEASR